MVGRIRSRQVQYLPTGSIRANPQQPRRSFDAETMTELARSVAEIGMLQPLSVHRTPDGYELVSGERRLRAARMAGLHEVPCIVLSTSEAESGLFALVENLQRRDLDYLEAAEGIAHLITRYSMSQTEAARRLGMSQSAIANKLRLLQHPPQVRAALRESGLSERHARALLLAPEDQRLRLIRLAADEGWPVARLEQELSTPANKKPHGGGPCDLRLAVNAVEHTVNAARRAGIRTVYGKEETDGEIVLTVTLTKAG